MKKEMYFYADELLNVDSIREKIPAPKSMNRSEHVQVYLPRPTVAVVHVHYEPQPGGQLFVPFDVVHVVWCHKELKSLVVYDGFSRLNNDPNNHDANMRIVNINSTYVHDDMLWINMFAQSGDGTQVVVKRLLSLHLLTDVKVVDLM